MLERESQQEYVFLAYSVLKIYIVYVLNLAVHQTSSQLWRLGVHVFIWQQTYFSYD